MPHKIYIGNVPERARPDDYKDYFGKCGMIVNIEPKNGFGFVVSVPHQCANPLVWPWIYIQGR
ncbi:hypothetical protein BC938DRAFT_480547 [Jimgerdemannia flammicorona]|uniref:RRM domain-containing protein n=1 Tax=Jimgerdemannia flammicorona TaxID=994334 RepID=A0A433QIG6_9FUNG|nr:hypothetical protein BC938DRAFT_480547 [Jimgerdemannia flammicorona]